MRDVGNAWNRQHMNVGNNERKGGVRMLCFQDSCLSGWSKVVPSVGSGKTQRSRRSFSDKSHVDPAQVAIGDLVFGTASCYSGKGIPLTPF